MRRLRSILELLFGREIRGLKSLAQRLDRGVRAAAKTPESPARRHSHSSRRTWTPVASTSVSLVIHALLVLAVLRLTLAPPSEPKGDQEVTIRWIQRKKAPPPKPPRTPPEPDTTVRTPTTTELPPPDQTEPQTTASTTRETPEERTDLTRAQAPQDVKMSRKAKPMGLGVSPPALPQRASRRATDRSGTLIYANRGSAKQSALRRFGGSAATEDAVARGLRWLATHQDRDGGWSAYGFSRHCRDSIPCSGPGSDEFDVGVSALAVLAFLGAGHIPAQDHTRRDDGLLSQHRETVRNALAYLLRRQDASGGFGLQGMHYMYNHAIASLAMIEAASLTEDDEFIQSAARAVRFSVSCQQDGGGWDYRTQSTGRNDLSITGWQIMALSAARNAHLTIPESTQKRMKQFIATAFTRDGIGIYANIGTESGRRGINMVAVGLLSKLLLGDSPRESAALIAANRLLKASHAPSWKKMRTWEKTFQSYYYWYTATMALFLHSGESDNERWQAWNHLMKRALLVVQSGDEAHTDGSWPPEPNWIGVSGGRVYATAMNVLTLETYYRYEPVLLRQSNETGSGPIRGTSPRRNRSHLVGASEN